MAKWSFAEVNVGNEGYRCSLGRSQSQVLHCLYANLGLCCWRWSEERLWVPQGSDRPWSETSNAPFMSFLFLAVAIYKCRRFPWTLTCFCSIWFHGPACSQCLDMAWLLRWQCNNLWAHPPRFFLLTFFTFENVCVRILGFFFFLKLGWTWMLLYCFSAVSRPLGRWDHAYNATLFSPNFFTYHSSGVHHTATLLTGELARGQATKAGTCPPNHLTSEALLSERLPLLLIWMRSGAQLDCIGWAVWHARRGTLHVDVQKAVRLLPVPRLWWNLHSLLSVDNRRGRTERGYLIKLAITIMNMDIASAWPAPG